LSTTLYLLAVLLFMTSVMSAAWLYCRRAGNSGWTDVFWTFGTGAALAGAALASTERADGPMLRQLLSAALVLIWAGRLGGYVASRVAGKPEDRRYAGFRKDWGERFQIRMLWVSLIQAPATALLAISVFAAAHRPGAALDLRDGLAFAVLAVAIAGEALADRQMAVFRRDPDNHGRVADTGLWAWSRHPNYFFEWTAWLAWPVMALDPLQPASWLTLIAPAVMYLVLTRGSGIPPLEAAMLASRGEAYRRYQAQTSAFFPLPPRKQGS
jgi:steroid 5-alpha reductase family enzyme